MGACEPNARADDPTLPAGFDNKLVLLDMLRGSKFEALDDRLTALQTAFKAGDGSEASVVSAFNAFMNTEPAIRRRLDEWVGANPQSYAAKMARGANHWRLGWDERGAKYASKTSPEQFAEMSAAFALARQDLYDAIKIEPKLTAAYVLIIFIAMAEGRKAEVALATYNGLRDVPHSFFIREKFLFSRTPWWGGGTAASIDEQISRMADQMDDFPALGPLAGYTDYVTGQLRERNRKYADAIVHYDRAIRFGEHWRYFQRRGWAHYKSGDFDSALADYDRARALRPQEPELLSDRGWIQYRAGRADDALEDLTLALEFLPLDSEIRTNRAIVLKSLKRYEEAIEDLDVAAVYGSYDRRVVFNRGQILYRDLNDPCLSGCNPRPLYVGCAVIRQAMVSEWKLMF